MPSKPKVSSDPLVMVVRKALKDIEPRPLPTETLVNDYGRKGWKCPLCGTFCHRTDRAYGWGRHQKQQIDYSSYNMHFAHYHAQPFWREKHIIEIFQKLIVRDLEAMQRDPYVAEGDDTGARLRLALHAYIDRMRSKSNGKVASN